MFGCCRPSVKPAAPRVASSVVVLGRSLGGGGVLEAAKLAVSGRPSVVLLEPTWAEVDRSRATALALGLADRIAVHHHAARPWLSAAAA